MNSFLKLKSDNNKIKIIFIFLLSLSIRLIYGLYIYNKTGTTNFCDDWDYISYAKNILNQGIFVTDLSKFFSNSYLIAPGYPLIVALFFYLFGFNYLPLIIFNAVLSSFITILIYYLAIESFSKLTALWASFWSIFYILFIKYIPHILKEEFNIFLFLLTLLLFIRSVKTLKLNYKLLLFSFVFTYLIHTDERFFVYFPIFLLFFIIYDKKNGIKKSLAFFIIVILLMVPWFIRNYKVYSKPVILTERTAQITDKILGYDTKKEINKKDTNFYITMADSIKKGHIPKSHFHFKNALIYAIKHKYYPHPYNRFERWYEELKELWRPFRFSGGFVKDGYRFEPPWSLKHNLSLIMTYGILLPFFFIGIILCIKEKIQYCFLYIVIIILHTLIHLFFVGARNRYRIPIDPLIIIISFYALFNLKNYFTKNYRKK